MSNCIDLQFLVYCLRMNHIDKSSSGAILCFLTCETPVPYNCGIAFL